MAATTATNLQVLGRIIEGYMAAHAPEQFSLIRSGIVQTDTNPPFSATNNAGNTFTVKGWINDTSDDQTPSAGTNMTPVALTSYTQKGVVLRRAKIYGMEDFASLAGGVGSGEWSDQVARTISHNVTLNLEKRVFQKLLVGLFDPDSGCLKDTNLLDRRTYAFDWSFVQEARALMGENVDLLSRVIMHPTVFYKSNIAALVEARANNTASDLSTSNNLATTSFVGTLQGGIPLFLNSRLYNSGGVYDTIIAGPGAITFSVQLANSVKAFRDEYYAGGADMVKYANAYSVHVNGTTWNTTEPAGIGGATDASLAAAASWTTTGDFVATKCPMVVVKSLATLVS